ncbi:MAG: hypothetical protein J6B28_02735 [Eubacterium sp.]|nr:hypothetical protein [Eubacterium sp.]
MLTITAPIELKCKAPTSASQESFFHRITGNYSMIQQRLQPEDLLHVMTTPPEYYFGDGDQTNIFQQMNVNTVQENKLEIMNNLVNRILVRESAELTYQDRVYITNVLQKFGIQNVNEFMKQVSHVTEELQNTEELVKLYWNHAGELKQLVENYKSESYSRSLQHHTQEETQEIHLHEAIMNRLQTAAIYQTVQNFNSRRQGDTVITSEELQLSDQRRITQNILLNKLKNEARGEASPLIYRHENFYEEQQLSQEELNEEHVLQQVKSAALLNFIDNVYQAKIERNHRTGDTWYHMERAFYQNADNTMKRFENRMNARYDRHTDDNRTYIVQHNRADRHEIDIMNRLFENYHSPQYQTVQAMLRPEKEIQHVEKQNLINQWNETVEEDYVTQEEYRYQDEHRHYEQQTVDARNLSVVEEEISRINRENINNQSRYIQMMQHIQASFEQPGETKTSEQMRRESLMALEHPQEMLQQLQEEGQQQQELHQQELEKAMNLLPEETRLVYETVKEYLEAPIELRRQMSGVSNDMGVLIRDIHHVQTHQEQIQMVHLEQEQIQEQTKEMIERWNDKIPVELTPKRVYERQRTNVTFVHKQQEQQIDEEYIEQMLIQNRQMNQTVKTTSETVTNYEQKERTYQNINTDRMVQQTENVSELVRQGVQKELGALSEKIYAKLEKRLETEKRRRGY